ncbi:MAG: HAMP domain-containing sensor histidine kinase [Candidatus Gracilibacteria bacterium]|nr:HAMP domain-containing sensor histidine kinase [Candidatus Gracilibacteria bacterium]
MNLSKEHKLAIKISIILLFFAILLASIFPYYNHYMGGNFSGYGMMGKNSTSKYLIFFILTIIVYFFSYVLAKITIKPIEEHNEKLKSYNHNLAHEIKTPLSIIKTNLELLDLGYDKDLIKSSSEEIENMQKIIDSLLFLSEKNELNSLKKVSFLSIVQKYTNEKILLYSKGDFIVNGNEVLLDTLIKNLIDNAIKYNIGDEKIIIKITKNSFEISNKTDIFITKEEQDKLFDIFYQANNSKYGQGYGLGLSIVKKIIVLHNLNINIKTENGIFKVIVN